MLNTLLQEERVLVGPEAGLTRDSVRVEFEYQGRTVYMVIPFFHVFYLNNGRNLTKMSQQSSNPSGAPSLILVCFLPNCIKILEWKEREKKKAFVSKKSP